MLCKDGVGNFEGAMSCAIEATGVAGTIKLLRHGIADWANYGLSDFHTICGGPSSASRREIFGRPLLSGQLQMLLAAHDLRSTHQTNNKQTTNNKRTTQQC